jgi:hypothetical protein
MSKNTIFTIIIILAVAVGGYFYYSNKKASSLELENNEVPATENTPPVQPVTTPQTKKPATPVAQEKVVTSGTIENGGIRLLTPTSGQKIESGSTITVKYEITKPVTFGTIMIDCAPHQGFSYPIENKKPGSYSFSCELPKSIGESRIAVLDINYSDLKNSTATFGQFELIQAKNTLVKDIGVGEAGGYSQSDLFLQATPRSMNDGFVYTWLVMNNGSKTNIAATDFSVSFTDPSIASLFKKGETIEIDAKKIGETDMVVSYKGFSKKIRIHVSPCDDTLDICKPI